MDNFDSVFVAGIQTVQCDNVLRVMISNLCEVFNFAIGVFGDLHTLEHKAFHHDGLRGS